MRLEGEQTVAQAGIYSVATLGRVKLLLNSNVGTGGAAASDASSGEYVCSAFCGDNKHLALLLQLDDTDRPDATQIQVIQNDIYQRFVVMIFLTALMH